MGFGHFGIVERGLCSNLTDLNRLKSRVSGVSIRFFGIRVLGLTVVCAQPKACGGHSGGHSLLHQVFA